MHTAYGVQPCTDAAECIGIINGFADLVLGLGAGIQTSKHKLFPRAQRPKAYVCQSQPLMLSSNQQEPHMAKQM